MIRLRPVYLQVLEQRIEQLGAGNVFTVYPQGAKDTPPQPRRLAGIDRIDGIGQGDRSRRIRAKQGKIDLDRRRPAAQLGDFGGERGEQFETGLAARSRREMFDTAKIHPLLEVHRVQTFVQCVTKRTVEIGVNGKFAGTVALRFLPCR